MWPLMRRAILAAVICLHVCSSAQGARIGGYHAAQDQGSLHRTERSPPSSAGPCHRDEFHCYKTNDCTEKVNVCDGEEDCPNGEDEDVDCQMITCGEGLFRCAKGSPFCIAEGYVCDNDKDCADGSDEDVRYCLKHKIPGLKHKVHDGHVIGEDVQNSFRCLPTQYQCPNTHRCIDFEKLCDNIVDCLENGADEGQHCRNRACLNTKCSHKCRETLKGSQCFCETGKKPLKNGTCVDLNECEYDGFCDQLCDNDSDDDSDNHRGDFTCSCVKGYVLDEDTGGCTADNSDQAALLVANYMSLLLLDLDPQSDPKDFNITGEKITSVDYSINNNSACWTTYNQEKGASELKCSSLTDKNKVKTIDTHFKLTSVHQIALDWISGNWYFVDDKRDRIFLCTSDGQHCLTVIYHGISRPKSIAIDSSRGYIFYADWSSNPKLGRANLDGSAAIPNLVNKKIIHPSVITLDFANQHVYWADSFLNTVSRMDYDGANRRPVFDDTHIQPHHGLTLFENYLYISNVKVRHHSIVRVHRYNRSEKPVFFKQTLTKPGALQVVHQARQPGYDSEICMNKCSHICIPMPDGHGGVTAKCTCRAGYTLKDDTQCEKNVPDKFLIYANAQQGNIRGISMDGDSSHDVMEPIYNLNRPVALAYHAKTRTVYFSDVSMLRIGQRSVDSSDEATTFMASGVTSCEGLAVDWVGGNLYWTDDGHQTINVVRLDNTSITHTIINSTNHPRSIVVDPNEGYMYWIDLLFQPPLNVSAKIERAALDGSDRSYLVSDNITWPNSLYLDTAQHRLYWTDAYSDTIESIFTNGTDRKVEQKLEQSTVTRDHHHPYGVALNDGKLYWTESLQGYINTISSEDDSIVHLHNDSTPLFDLILFDKDSQTIEGEKPCATNNGGCSDLCLSLANGLVCTCANGRRIKEDGVTCEGIPDYNPPPVCDANFKFPCKNGDCINIRFKCDGDYDCADRSDEDMSDNGICRNFTCPDESMFACGNRRCIYAQFVCDGEFDCIDNSDEHSSYCNADRKCPANYTKCNDSSRCIPDSWRCDHDNDCSDGSDEDETCQYPTTCGPNQLQCGSGGRCIPYAYRCDNEYDCKDHSDEWDCSDWCDPVREFQCADSSVCIPKVYQCDNEFNCDDKSDEANCTTPKGFCDKENEFQCETGSCIANIWRCDNDRDCEDGSDEVGCETESKELKCHYSEFQCEDKQRCIPIFWRCDMDNDCNDTSDEKDCKFESPCLPPKFSCPGHNNTCLDLHRLCDNNTDCPDRSDEGRLCDYDMCINHDCSHNCHRSPDGFVCSCPDNMRLNLADNKTCVPIDACEKWGVCSQICANTPDGHQCLCHPGYLLANDRYSCKPNDSVPIYIIFSNRHEIRRYDLGTMNYLSLVSGLRNTIALDFHYANKWIFWTDVVDDKIYRGYMMANTLVEVADDSDPPSITDIQPIIDVGLATTEGLAIDWIANNIYWVESNLDQIEVAKLDGSDRSTLIAGNMISPRAIVLDPRDGVLFWTDWDGQKPRIEGCSMSGEDRRIVYDITKVQGGGWPNGLTLDYDARRLYWVDARSDSIHTIMYNGHGHRRIISNHDVLDHPFALTMFEHYVYWTDWKTNSLVRANKFNGSDVHTIQRTFTQPFDVQVFHPKRQPQAPNPCQDKNGGCSHLCLIGKNNRAVCKCPHRMKLTEDGKSCDRDNKFLLFVKENEIRGVDLNNAHFNVIPSITLPFVENATAIDYDSKEHKLYWTDIKRNVICSAFINGTGVETVIDSGISNPEGFAIDWLSRNMYFSSYDDQKASISVAKLNGAFRTEIISKSVPELRKPNSIAVHPTKGLMFWSDVGGDQHRIIKANMDGSNVQIIVPDAQNPASLTLDVESNKLYWISREKKIVLTCNLDGNDIKQFDKEQSLVEAPMSMTFHNNTIIVANTTSIMKFNTNTDSMRPTRPLLMRDNTRHVHAMQVYDPKVREGGSNGCSNKANGDCEQMCLPTGKESRICKCTAGFTAKGTKCQGIDSFLLYSTESEIHGFALDSMQSEALAPISQISLAASVDFHAQLDSIFWVDSDSRTISRINRDLTSRETIIEQRINGIEGIAVDWIAGNIYWTDRGYDTIEVANLNGTHRYVVMHGDMEKPKAITVHPVLGYLFFTDWGSEPKIVRARLDGTNRENWITTDIKAPYGLTIDYTSNALYWCDKSLDVIERVDIPTGKRTVIYSNLTDCVGLAVFGNYIYWADSTDGSGSIKKALKKDGSNVEILKDNIKKKLKDIKIFDHTRQIGSNICQGNSYGCEQLCLFKGNNTATCACSFGKLNNKGKTCEDYSDFLLVSEVTALQSIHMKDIPDPNSPTKPIQNATSMRNVIGLAFDHTTQRIFYSDIQIGNIQAVTFNGTYLEEIVQGVGAAEGLAFDGGKQDLYWTSYTNSSISKINLGLPPKDREVQVLIQLTLVDHPRAIAIDVCRNKMFWTNWNDEKPSIQMSSLEGYRVENIITDNIRTPNGLTIDHKGQKLYWTDARLDKIERCNFDGTERVVIVTKVPQHSFGIAVYGDYLYWTDWMLRGVLRANKYDGQNLIWLKKGIKRQPMGIIAVANDTNDCTLNPCFGELTDGRPVCDEMCSVNDHGRAVCSCGPGHTLLPDKWRCADASLNCSMHDFVCDDKKRCIPITKTCNSINDCLDGSDEDPTLCGSSRECPSGYFTCGKTGRCITLDKICDGKTDCGSDDETDELDCPCTENQFKCSSKLCINIKYRCDRDSDCPDHSDEIGCNLTCSELEIDGEYLEGLVSCNTTSACIYPSWKCDGSNDCWDNSDEKDCDTAATTECPDKSFKCKTGSCIPPQWKCDRDNDCGDNSDEEDCSYNCDTNEFQCNNSLCIPSTWRCDGHPDCPDESDETDDCENITCGPDKFRCTTGRCIPRTWMCDDDPDCDNAADENQHEANCTAPKCDSHEFMCNNGRCIRLKFYCDKDDDCEDGSDELEGCEMQECAYDQYQCADKSECIQLSRHCDGKEDCGDGSDEAKCDVSPCGNVTQFQCHNHVCISDDLVCNGNNDCGDNSDEPSQCGVNECLSYQRNHTHTCTQKCRDKKIGFECGCRNGFKLLSDGITCIDVDECNTSYPCSHLCVNTVGSYICSCPAHYELESDKQRCRVLEENPSLLVSNRYYIRRVEIPRGNMTILTKELFNSVAIDYDWRDKFIYWSDITSVNSSINRMSFDGTNKTEVLHSTTVRNPDGLAVDWIGRNLYWCDKTTDTIEVSKLNGDFRKVLLREGLQEPRGLEVFPSRGYIFFTDWGDNPHISRMWMDGTNRQTIVKENLAWPNALTVDYVTEKIFWADGSLDYIAMANLDGSARRVVISDKKLVPHVFALATFESHLFWSDWEKSGIFYADKFSGKNIKMLAKMVHRPMDIQVLHKYRQLPAKVDGMEYNPCNTSGCTHLCLLRPSIHSPAHIEAICACPENHYLGSDKKSCISNCTNAQFLCAKSSKCIPKWWLCDNHTDCNDQSDEPATCSKYHCEQPGLFQCSNATDKTDCYVPTVICDGVAQCSDGSDEEECEEYPCMEHQFKCASNKTCISRTMKCNGHIDCSDGEDEEDCPKASCTDNQFQCANGRCVPYVWRCDHDNDCGDGSDEHENCKVQDCKSDHFKCNGSGRCIPNAWKCDGDPDCGDNDDTDEKYEECHSRTCDPTYFKCDNGHCIPGRWQCDYYDDCRDGSDETQCTPRNCSEAEMKCDNGKCIRKSLHCDGEVHCEDGSDERNCANKTCDAASEFKCEKVVHCIPKSWHCDGDTDCADGTDEIHCNRTCSKGEFRCKNDVCIPLQWQCDGDDDCSDNSDEEPRICAKYSCGSNRFQCTNNICIWKSHVCDGKEDCSDGVDEKNCQDRKKTCKQFECADSKQCISYNLVCDGTHHCEDKSDEKSYCDSVKRQFNCSNGKNGGCEQNCVQLKVGVKCLCKDGYQLNDNGFTCDPSNPCDKWGMCSQKCSFSKTNERHYCNCTTGFERKFGVEGSCVALGPPPSLLIAERTRVFHSPTVINYNNSEPGVKQLNVSWTAADGLNSTIVAMSVDTTGPETTVFTVTEDYDNMWRVHKNVLKGSGNKRVTRDTKKNQADPKKNQALWFGHAKISDISLDWLQKRIYYIDATTKSIQLRDYEGQYKIHIIDRGLQKPTSIAVDPHSGRIFWTEQGVRPKIGWATLDGSHQETLVRDELDWPNGITVDHQNGWVYWADTKKSTVETISVEGKGRTIVHRFDESDPPYKVEVFEDYLYILTYKKNQILKMHKFLKLTNENPSKIQPVYTGNEQVNAIVIIQEHKMDTDLVNNCDVGEKENPRCKSGMCFHSPTEEKGYTCKCPKYAKMTDEKCDFKNPCNGYCQNNGICNMTVYDEPKCTCSNGYEGARCEVDMCQSYCLNRGTCIRANNISCSCPPGYKGRRCQNYRCTDYCRNQGMCYIDSDGEPQCMCVLPFGGKRCESNVTTDCSKVCVPGNYDGCEVTIGSKPTCSCKEPFKGPRCDQCDHLFCYNGGHCTKDGDHPPTCACKPNYDPDVQCTEFTCDYKCKTNYEWKGNCKCNGKCPGPECGPDIGSLCNNYCLNGGVCSIDQGKSNCRCQPIYSGKKCSLCKCEPGGDCIHTADGRHTCRCKYDYIGRHCELRCSSFCQNNATCDSCHLGPDNQPLCRYCICKEGYSGTLCEKNVAESTQASAGLNPLFIILPAIAVVILLLVVLAAVFIRRRRRLEQYGHKRMKEPNSMDVKNPMYRHEDEADERDPLGSNPIFRGDASTNFANPMYDVYNTSESTQMLLNQEVVPENEENQLLEEGSNVRYFGTSDAPLKLPKA